MHILVCDDDAAFSAKVAEYAATYFEAHEIPVQATVCSDPEQVLAIPDLELYRIAFLDVDMPQVNGIALGGQLRHRNPDICLVYVSAYLAFALDGYKVNAYRYILKRDVAKQLPSCLEDIYASMMQAGTKTLTVHHNRENIRIPLDQIYYLESEGRVINVYGDIAREHFCTFYGKLKELPSILARNGFFAGGPQRCGQPAACVRHPELPGADEKRRGAQRQPQQICGCPRGLSGMEGAVR